MRTRVDLDEEVLRVAKDLASERNQSSGKVLSDLVRRGLEPTGNAAGHSGIPVLSRKPGARAVTFPMVKDLLETEP